jgi:DNA-binding GntR family transcriptional regulator
MHLALLRAAGNRRTLKTIGELQVMTLVFGHRRRTPDVDELRKTCGVHQRIIDALIAGDSAAAREAVAENIRRGCDRAIAQHDRARMETAAGQVTSLTFPDELRQRIREMEKETEAGQRATDG